MMRAIIVAACFIVAACGATAPAGTNGIAATSTPFVRPTVASTSATSDVTPEPEPTDTPDAGPSEVKLGESVRITCDGQDCMDVVVLKDTTATRYKDPDGYYNDTPDHKGDVFLAVEVRYTAIGSNADYNEFDWGLYVNDEQVQDHASVLHGPQPELSANDLPKGKKVTGWIVWEIPTKGRVVLSYEPGSNGSIFEVVLRSK